MIIICAIFCGIFHLSDLAAISVAICLLADVILFKDYKVKVKIKE